MTTLEIVIAGGLLLTAVALVAFRDAVRDRRRDRNRINGWWHHWNPASAASIATWRDASRCSLGASLERRLPKSPPAR